MFIPIGLWQNRFCYRLFHLELQFPRMILNEDLYIREGSCSKKKKSSFVLDMLNKECLCWASTWKRSDDSWISQLFPSHWRIINAFRIPSSPLFVMWTHIRGPCHLQREEGLSAQNGLSPREKEKTDIGPEPRWEVPSLPPFAVTLLSWKMLAG